jgi:hypothetical protein
MPSNVALHLIVRNQKEYNRLVQNVQKAINELRKFELEWEFGTKAEWERQVESDEKETIHPI